jgi:predicted nuclease with TOPRIM domain
MSDERADLILNLLRSIRNEQSAQREKLDEIIVRLGRLEREVAGLHSDYAGLSVRLDNLDRRVGRIEQRLELVDVQTANGR